MRSPHDVRSRSRLSKLLGRGRAKRPANRAAFQVESLEARQMLTGVPIITEFMAQNTSTTTDEDGAFSDWIELFNPDPTPLSLEGWHLTDKEDQLAQWTFPAVTLDSGEYLVVFASSKNRLGTGPEGEYHTNFSLGVNGEYLALVHPDGTTVAQEFVSNGGEYPQQYANISYGLAPVTSEETYFLAPSPGAANSGPTTDSPGRQIVINELMYHASSESPAEEYIELLNTGTTGVDVTGWQFSRGVTFTIPSIDASTPRVIPAGGYLVVAADTAAFAAKYPAVNPAIVVGGWTGQLSDRYEAVELEDAGGNRIDLVEYADEGDWADRIRGPLDFGHEGWIWSALHDGGGRSLELINSAMTNNQGQNWDASTTAQGTPGAANSIVATNIAPLIGNVTHFPVIPHANDPVTITAAIRDELATGITATLHWRVDRANNTDPFITAAMFDDGAHGDGAAGDGIYGASIIAPANNAIVEYYVGATDSTALVRTWPAPTDGSGTQGANALFQVDNTFAGSYSPGADPLIRMIMTETERAELQDIGDGNQSPANETLSDAQMNGTFIVFDGTGITMRYLVGIRNRGGSSRVGPPNNFHVSIPKDNPWLDRSDLTINAYYPQSQVLGSAVFQHAGQPVSDSLVIQVRVNNTNLAESGNRMLGHYVLNEARNSDFVGKHFPGDDDGNLYTISDDPGDQGDLRYEGEDPDAYRDAYTKETNEELDDWTDLINLTNVLENAPDANYLADVSQVADVRQWFRHFAVDTLLANREGGLATGRGDDYMIYSGVTDPRFKLVPHDLDTLLGINSGFQANSSIFTYEQVNGLFRLFNNPQTVPFYFEQLLDVMNTTLAPENFNPLVDQLLGSWVPAGNIQTIKDNAAARRAYILGIIPTQLTVQTTLASLGGFARTTDLSTVNLSGTMHAAKTRSVRVDGVAANINAKNGTWSLNTVPLRPGINRLLVQAFDGANGTGNLIEQQFIDVWSEPAGSGQNLTGTISSNRTLTAAAGPYRVTGDVTVAAGVTLTIEPGTSIYFDAGTQLNINGRLVAEGTQHEQIRFTRTPNTTANWDGIQFSNSMEDNRLTWAIVEWSSPTTGSNQGMVGLSASNLTIDHSYFDHAERRRIRSQNSSLIVRNSYFADLFAPGVPPSTDNLSEHIWGGGIPNGGHFIAEGNYFGRGKGHNDAIDFDSSLDPAGPKAQILNNYFAGGGDDATDMLGYVYIEGNTFVNNHKDEFNLDPGQSNVNSSSSGDYTVVRNIYYNVDHVTLTKEDAFTTFTNNTVVTADYSAIYFDLAGQTSGPGVGANVDGSIFYDLSNEGLFAEVLPTTQLSLNRSIVPIEDTALGLGNIAADPRFVNAAALDFRLRPGSPAIGTGPNGLDMGAYVPRGASISGEPAAVTSLTTASLTIGGPGITHYRYSLDGGAFSAGETAVATPLALAGLANGTHSVRVIGKNAAGVWQAEAEAAVSKSWTVQTAGVLPVQVVINEVLASNNQAIDLGGTRPDSIELYNRGDVAVELGGLSLSDNPNNPTKYFFPAGTMIPARGYLVVYADSGAAQGAELHTGFSLASEGEGVYLYNSAAAGGALLDSVEFGIQLADMSIGRLPGGGAWGLAQPTFGAANRAQPLGEVANVSINEWFTSGSYTLGGNLRSSDFVELYNPDAYPVAIGGMHLTDNPADDPLRHAITPLSFIAAGGYSVFLADDQEDDGANHLNFELEYLRGWIGLNDADGAVVDQVLYNSQTSGYSQGRVPDGGVAYQFFAQPTPGLDSSPPSTPANLRFTLLSDTQVDIAWDASTDAQSGVTEYRVYRGGALVAVTSGLTFSDTEVEPGTSYSYQVSAVNGDGVEGAPSNSLSTGIDSSPPSVPSGLSGIIAGAAQINLTWNASSDPQSGVKEYKIYRNGALLNTSTTPSFNDTAAPVGALVSYEVSAVNNDDVESNRSLAANLASFQDGVAPAGYDGTRDTWLNENNASQINGTANAIDIDGEDPLENLGLIRWDLSSITAGNTVASAAITVNVSNGSNTPYEIFAALKNWTEAAANWNVAAPGQNWQTPGARGAADRGTTELGAVSGGTGVRTFILNAAGVAQIQQWINNPATNFGFIISDDGNTDGIVFGSREATNANNRPRLSLSFNPPAPNDITPPTTPAGLIATNDGASRITLNWLPADDPETGVTSYNIFRGGTQIGTSSTTSFIDTGRTPGVTYAYRVSAVNGVGLEGTASTPATSHSIPIDSTVPSAPTNIVATDNGISQITLSWNAATDAQSGIASYKIFRDGVEVGTSSTTSFVDAGRTPEVDYSYTVAAVNGQNLTGPISTPPVVHHITPLPLTLQLQTRDSYLPGVAVLVRVEIQGSDGKPDRSIWDATATLSSSNPAVTLSTNTVQLRNGIGTALVTFTGSGAFSLNAVANGLNASKPLASLAGVAQTNVSGTLPGAATDWSGVIRVTGDVTVPAGHTLTIQPGTLVLVDGTATPLSTSGFDIIVAGRVNSLGSAASPVTITATNPSAPWGEINHTSSQASLYQYTDITRGGHAPRGGHTNTGPAIRTSGSTITFDHSNITDVAGKTMQGSSSNLTFRDTIFSRSVMGPEITGTGLLMEDSYIFDMLGIYREDGVNDDADGIYIHAQGAGREVIIRGGVVAHVDDDGIDTLGSDVLIDGTIIRDATNTNDDPKAITILEGTNIIRNVLIVNADIGISAKAQGGEPNISNNSVEHVTIYANSIAVQAEDKNGIPTAQINYNIKNSILRAPDAIATDYDPAAIIVNYSNVSEVWPGTGNQTADPLFVDAAGNDFRLQPNSPAIDAGDPTSPLDPDGTRTDMGAFPFTHTPVSSPRVAAVMASSSAWSAALLARLSADGLGTGGFALPLGAGSPALLPFNSVDRIRVRFTEAVDVEAGDLVLHGVNVPNYAIAGVTYDPATFTATWSLAAPIAADKLLVRVRDTVQSTSGGSLDGEPTAFPSGNGTAGGDFTLRFDVLPGDATGDRSVGSADVFETVRDGFRDATMASYAPMSDFNGDGLVNVVDSVLARNHNGAALPAGTPSSPVAPDAVVTRTSRVRVAAAAIETATETDERLVASRRVRSGIARSIAVDQVLGDLSTVTGSLSAKSVRAGRRGR